MASANEQRPDLPATPIMGERTSARPTSQAGARRRAPAWLPVALLVLACLGLLLSTLTLWTGATLLNTDRFVALVSPLEHDPQVIDGVSTSVADQVVTALDIPGRTASALPVGGKFLAGPLEKSVHDFVQARTAALLSNGQLHDAWQAAMRSLHAHTVAALRGQSSDVTISGDTLTVDLMPLTAAVLHRLQQEVPSFLSSALKIPDFDGTQSAGEERQALAQALGISLPPDFGIVTVQSAALATAQRAVAALDALRIVLPLVTLALAAAAVWFAADRRRALLQLGIGVVVAFLLAALIVQIILSQITAPTTAKPAREIADAVIGLVRASLVGLLLIVALAGALLTVGAHLAGRPAWLTRLLPARGRTSGAAPDVPPDVPPLPAS